MQYATENLELDRSAARFAFVATNLFAEVVAGLAALLCPRLDRRSRLLERFEVIVGSRAAVAVVTLVPSRWRHNAPMRLASSGVFALAFHGHSAARVSVQSIGSIVMVAGGVWHSGAGPDAKINVLGPVQLKSAFKRRYSQYPSKVLEQRMDQTPPSETGLKLICRLMTRGEPHQSVGRSRALQ